MEEIFNIETVEPQFSRTKGASWFPLLYTKDVMVLGQGGIGSWVSLLLSRIGCNLHIFDMDTYEVHNMTGQFVRNDQIGMNKVEAISELLLSFSPYCSISTFSQKYTESSFTNDVVICGFDNMVARKIAYEKWKKNMIQDVQDEGADPQAYFFQDGRLLAEQLQIFSFSGDQRDKMEEYEKEWLFEDSEVEEAPCTFKQTSHCAAMIASHMVGFLTNWASNLAASKLGKPQVRQIPFMFEYSIPVNLVYDGSHF
jgi:hypothetical protein